MSSKELLPHRLEFVIEVPHTVWTRTTVRVLVPRTTDLSFLDDEINRELFNLPIPYADRQYIRNRMGKQREALEHHFVGLGGKVDEVPWEVVQVTAYREPDIFVASGRKLEEDEE